MVLEIIKALKRTDRNAWLSSFTHGKMWVNAEIFGGGPNAFSRYENGKTRPPLSLVQLFKLLDRHPELLDEIREKKNLQASTQETTPARIARRKRIYA